MSSHVLATLTAALTLTLAFCMMQFKSFRPLTHTYFAMASANPNEQFYYFTSLVSWLLSLLGQEWKAPSQLDDPNSAVASLYAMLQQIGATLTPTLP